jgi:hypothetical protein
LITVTNINTPAGGREEIMYQVRLNVSSQSLALVTQGIRLYRQQVKSRWRKLSDLQTAVIVLAVLRKDERPADMAAAYQVSHHSVRRWAKQVLTVLARMAPRLERVLARAARKRADQPVLLLDGTCLPVQTPGGKAEKRYWCAKHKAHHLRIMTLTNQHGRLLWASAAQPAGLHETTQAKRLQIPRRLRRHRLAIIVDRYHTRLDDQPDDPTVMHGRRGSRNHKLTRAEKQVNALLARERVGNEHAHAHLKNWRILTRLRHDLRDNATTLLRALLVLTLAEVNR